MPRSALACAVCAGLLAAVAVAQQRIGLALTCVLLLTIAAGALAAQARRSPWMLALAAALAIQPVLRDAGPVAVVAVVGSLVAGAAAVAPAAAWSQLARIAFAPVRIVAGSLVVERAAAALLADAPARHAGPVLRGGALAVVAVSCFGALFVAADTAFAEIADDALAIDVTVWELVWRVALGVLMTAAGGALARAGRAPVHGPPREPRVPGRIELRIALGALVALFALFVAVQLRVLFGGADYVRATTGLGYGDYARQGFALLLLIAGLTLGVVALAARRRDRATRGLLGALCGLTLVVLASALHRLDLVEQAYGLTRVRYGGYAVILWMAAILLLVLAAGAHRRLAGLAPRAAVALTLAAALGYSLSNPDLRVAERAVARGGEVDEWYLAGLSADALPALERLPAEARDWAAGEVRRDLRRPDGLAGWNLARARARR